MFLIGFFSLFKLRQCFSSHLSFSPLYTTHSFFLFFYLPFLLCPGLLTAVCNLIACYYLTGIVSEKQSQAPPMYAWCQIFRTYEEAASMLALADTEFWQGLAAFCVHVTTLDAWFASKYNIIVKGGLWKPCRYYSLLRPESTVIKGMLTNSQMSH